VCFLSRILVFFVLQLAVLERPSSLFLSRLEFLSSLFSLSVRCRFGCPRSNPFRSFSSLLQVFSASSFDQVPSGPLKTSYVLLVFSALKLFKLSHGSLYAFSSLFLSRLEFLSSLFSLSVRLSSIKSSGPFKVLFHPYSLFLASSSLLPVLFINILSFLRPLVFSALKLKSYVETVVEFLEEDDGEV